MKSRLLHTVACATLMACVSGVAHAGEGWYIRGDIGYTFDGGVSLNTGDANLEPDFNSFVGAGYQWRNGVRLETELSHRFDDVKKHNGYIDGDFHAWAAMVNAYYDFNRKGEIKPYVGFGMGVGRIVGSATTVDAIDHFDDTDSVLSYQVLLGAAWRLSDQLDMDLGYRYFIAPDLRFNGVNTEVIPGGAVVTDASYRGDYDDQGVTIGLRWSFAPPPAPPAPPPAYVPPPPPPPPPAPQATACPESDFVVYFEWNRFNLNQEAADTISQAAARARQCNYSAAVVTGFTDTSGSARYNLDLSLKRADAVRDALVAQGFATDSITSQGHGETDLAKPTADGVREPLNRRAAVGITFH
ncbi:MAG: outer membrane beta-barrel protein [Pseudomonadota bacterium]